MLGVFHVNEIDDHQSAHVSQPELTGNFFGCLQVGDMGCFLNRVLAGSLSGVDIDGYEGFGLLDDDGSSGFEFYPAFKYRCYLVFKLEFVEQGFGALVQFDDFFMFGGNDVHETLDFAEHVFIIDQDFSDIRGKVVPDGPDRQIPFLVQ